MILLDLNSVEYKNAVCTILIFWFIMIIGDNFLFAYFFYVQSILHIIYFTCFFLIYTVYIYIYIYIYIYFLIVH